MSASENLIQNVTIAILAKDKAHILPLYLSCIERQTRPTNKTNLYIRTNNNTDNTATILREWIANVRHKYARVYFDDTDTAESVQKYGQHEWNAERFKVLGKIRQDSLNWAHRHRSHYFAVDCDNLIEPDTLESLVQTNLPIVAPFLRHASYEDGKGPFYSNYHASVDAHGYLKMCDLYGKLFRQEVKGLVQVAVVHCTYLVNYEVLDRLYYIDQTSRHEYVIFSESARNNSVAQYLDNRQVYGYITFAENAEELANDHHIEHFSRTRQSNQAACTQTANKSQPGVSDDTHISNLSFVVGMDVFKLASKNERLLQDACQFFKVAPNSADARILDLQQSEDSLGHYDPISSLKSILTSAIRSHEGHLYMDGCVFLTGRSQTVLLAGVSHCGKTSLTVALCLLLGWKLISEDLVIIDTATTEIVPKSCPLSLRPDTPRLLLEAFDLDLPKLYMGKWLVDHSLFKDDSISASVDFAIMLEQEREPNMLRTRKLVPAEFLRLALPVSNALSLPEGTEALYRCIDRADCTTMTGGSLKERFEYLLHLTTSAAVVSAADAGASR